MDAASPIRSSGSDAIPLQTFSPGAGESTIVPAHLRDAPVNPEGLSPAARNAMLIAFGVGAAASGSTTFALTRNAEISLAAAAATGLAWTGVTPFVVAAPRPAIAAFINFIGAGVGLAAGYGIGVLAGPPGNTGPRDSEVLWAHAGMVVTTFFTAAALLCRQSLSQDQEAMDSPTAPTGRFEEIDERDEAALVDNAVPSAGQAEVVVRISESSEQREAEAHVISTQIGSSSSDKNRESEPEQEDLTETAT